MEQNNNQSTYSRILWVMLSALGVLTLTVIAGIVLFYQPHMNPTGRGMAALEQSVNEYEADAVEDILASDEALDEAEKGIDELFDSAEWSQEEQDYPDLEESEAPDDEFTVTWNPDNDTPAETILEVDPNAFAERSQPKEEPAVQQTPAVVETRRIQSTVYWIQVGSFPSSFKAEMLSQKLYDKGIPATIQTQEVEGQTWYRIRVGAFSSQEEADHFKERIENLSEIEGSFIVQGSMMKEVPVN